MEYCKTNPTKTLDTCGCQDCINRIVDIEKKATEAMVYEFTEHLKKRIAAQEEVAALRKKAA